MILIASNGHFLTQIPQPGTKRGELDRGPFGYLRNRIREAGRNVPMHKGSEIKAILLFGPTSMQSFPSFTTGHDFLHS